MRLNREKKVAKFAGKFRCQMIETLLLELVVVVVLLWHVHDAVMCTGYNSLSDSNGSFGVAVGVQLVGSVKFNSLPFGEFIFIHLFVLFLSSEWINTASLVAVLELKTMIGR